MGRSYQQCTGEDHLWPEFPRTLYSVHHGISHLHQCETSSDLFSPCPSTTTWCHVQVWAVAAIQRVVSWACNHLSSLLCGLASTVSSRVSTMCREGLSVCTKERLEMESRGMRRVGGGVNVLGRQSETAPPSALFLCDICHRSFRRRQDITRHRCQRTRDKRRQVILPVDETRQCSRATVITDQLVCDMCGRLFRRKQDITRHKCQTTGGLVLHKQKRDVLTILVLLLLSEHPVCWLCHYCRDSNNTSTKPKCW